MASQDFIYDLLDKLEEGKQEYILMTIRSSKEESAGDLFYNFYYEDSKENAIHILRQLATALEERGDDIDNIDDIEIDLNDEDKDEE